eukprot:COSAG06_NODE_47598_length_338_cov_0.715481_1_plen_83_part_10
MLPPSLEPLPSWSEVTEGRLTVAINVRSSAGQGPGASGREPAQSAQTEFRLCEERLHGGSGIAALPGVGYGMMMMKKVVVELS